jgi:hypothetical protein
MRRGRRNGRGWDRDGEGNRNKNGSEIGLSTPFFTVYFRGIPKSNTYPVITMATYMSLCNHLKVSTHRITAGTHKVTRAFLSLGLPILSLFVLVNDEKNGTT